MPEPVAEISAFDGHALVDLPAAIPGRRGLTVSAAHRALVAQFLRFGTVGSFGFLVDWGVVEAARGWLGLAGAGLLSFFVAASANWFLNRIWTFKGQHRGRMHHQWLRFLAANAGGFVLNRGAYLILIAVAPLCVRYPVLAVAAGSIAGMGVNFFMARRVVFR